MPKHRTKVGIHARNDVHFTNPDYELLRRARIETLKTMTHTDVSVYQRLRQENPSLEFIVRLYDDRLKQGHNISPADFVSRMSPIISSLKPYATKFEIHNEPNHLERIEGWGQTDDDARAFRDWYFQVLSALKNAFPWARFGFPGLAPHHRDLPWLAICADAIRASHWLGCHTYWQYGNMMKPKWGLRFGFYHERFPNKLIEITEFGNSTKADQVSREQIADQYRRYYQELDKYSYLGSASAFIASSHDPAWSRFVWMKEGGEMLPVVNAVGNMERKGKEVAPPPTPTPPPEPPPTPEPPVVVTKRTFPETGKTVRGNFLKFFDQYGLDLCGFPITEEFEEYGFQAQYFQRLALEELKSGQMRLKLTGTEAWTSRKKIAELQARIQELSQQSPVVGPAKPEIQDITASLRTHPTKHYPTRQLGVIDQIVIHHTATSPTITPQRLADYQVRKRGKAGIGYHFVVAADGVIYQTNRLETVSDHAFSRNPGSVGIAFPGNFTQVIPSAAQLQAGGQLCAWLLGSLRLPTTKIVGLGEFVNTQSPGKQWLTGQKWKEKLLAQVEANLETGAKDQSALVASLREQIAALQAEIERLKAQPPAPGPTPEPGPAQVSKPPIQNLIAKLPKHKTKKYKTRPRSAITTLVVHHSATPASITPQRIAQYHVKNLQWPGVGYHFMISADGVVYQGNNVETLSFHATKGNPFGVGICFFGNFTNQTPPPEQLRAGAHLVAWLMQELNIDLDHVRGHLRFTATACPGKQWLKGKKWKQMLRQEVLKIQQEALEPTPAPGAKPIYHYMLFWTQDGVWADKDWRNAQKYIGTFAPSAGFKSNEAVLAEYVTIVGGPLGVPKPVEEWLEANGCKVDRIAGKDEAATKKLLDDLAKQKKRFLKFDG